MKPAEWTVGSNGRVIDIEIKGKFMTFTEARRLQNQLSDLIPSLPSDYKWDCTKPRPHTGYIYPIGWKH